MVARKLSSYDIALSENFSKRPSVYIDPESDIFEGLQHLQSLQSLEQEKCVNCLQIWRTNHKSIEGKIMSWLNHLATTNTIVTGNEILTQDLLTN